MGFVSCPVPSSPSHAASSLSGYEKRWGNQGRKDVQAEIPFILWVVTLCYHIKITTFINLL